MCRKNGESFWEYSFEPGYLNFLITFRSWVFGKDLGIKEPEVLVLHLIPMLIPVIDNTL
jgi:hypothetical protein